jgi:hypothetical protein
MDSKKTGRPRGLKKLPSLHPNTVCALARHWNFETGAAAPSKREVLHGAAAFSATIEPRLAELVLRVSALRDESEGPLRELRSDELDRFASVSRVAAAVGDCAFFEQVAAAMTIAQKCVGKPVRLAVLESWLEARKVENPPQRAVVLAGARYRLGRANPDSPPDVLEVIEGHLENDIFRDHLKALNLKCVSRISGKK